ncbi:MAG: D-alanine--D-alanine ligase [Clostridiaceae bacterium]|nr:D-alanine--D-alanine ligase [Clostridiaceae bacterium]
MRILVLAGGLSPERDVSLSSGCLIANALMKNGCEVAMADVFTGVDAEKTVFKTDLEHPYEYKIPEKEPDLDALRRVNPGNALMGPGILELARKADVVFLGLHGGMGENGQIQATLDTFGIPYTGSGYEACVLAMNKELTKKLLDAEEIPTPKGFVTKAMPENVPYPCFVKPVSGGSSIGTSRVDSKAELEKAIREAQRYEQSVLIEEMVCGREFSVGMLDGQVLPPIEIIPLEGFYDYLRKYQAGLTREICPAQLTAEQVREVQNLTMRVVKILGLRDYGRVDFIMNEKTGRFVCLEANTLPGMTPMSLLPQEARAVGISYEQVCKRIVELALAH